MGSSRNRVLLPLVLWQLACLMIFQAARSLPLESAVVTYYTEKHGDPQADYDAFTRFVEPFVWAFLVLETSIATALALRFHRDSNAGSRSFAGTAIAFAAWEFLVVVTLYLAYTLQVFWHLNQFWWWMFGPPENVYGFVNMVLPRLISWLICTVPSGLFALWLRDVLARPHDQKIRTS